MALTPDEILEHEFTKKGSKAYIASEVDEFLDRVNSDYESVLNERSRLMQENAALQAKVDELESKRDQVNQSILIAQEAADRLKAETDTEVKKKLTHAQESATKIIDDARVKASQEAEDLAQENLDLVAEQNQLREEVESFKDSFLQLLDEQRTLLENDALASAVHRLPLGKATEERAAKVVEPLHMADEQEADSEEENTEVVDESETAPLVEEVQATTNNHVEGPVVVFPDAEETK